MLRLNWTRDDTIHLKGSKSVTGVKSRIQLNLMSALESLLNNTKQSKTMFLGFFVCKLFIQENGKCCVRSNDILWQQLGQKLK